ncbi:MAG: glycosyltransferase [Pelolinea sp.]|nr:glycosyltransferase [Pelolinea sp.]
MINESSLPFVSIIVPVYNGEKTLEACVESLLGQTYPEDRREIIFVDNKSKDNTVKVLKPYANSGKIKVHNETKVLNAYGARNTGINAAIGDIVAFTDADCVAESNWLRELVASFSDQSIGCVAGEILPAQPNNVIEKYWDEQFLSLKRDAGKKIPRVLGGNCAFRHQVYNEIGYFREDIPSGGDTELAMRMVEKTNLGVTLNLRAVVRHHNVSTLRSFIKQSLRYGTQKTLIPSNDSLAKKQIPTILHAMFITITYFAVFLKRGGAVIFNSVPQSINMKDRDIYVLRPLLRIVNEWAAWWGYRFGVKTPDILR